MNDWLDIAVERIRNMPLEDLKALLDKHQIEYTEKEEDSEQTSERSIRNY